MALQKCEECGNEISSKANVCPHCGCPTKNETPKNETDEFNGFLKNETKRAVIDIRHKIKIVINKIKIVIQTNRSISKFIFLCIGIFFSIKSYKPGWSHYERFGKSYLFGPTFSPFYLIIGLAFILLAYFIHTKKWPPDNDDKMNL